MSSGMPELGSKISLISKADIRYEGRLFTVDPQECTIALASVRSFGTEDRETQFPVAPQSQVYDYILFRGSDIKDIRVLNNVPSIPNDPAIMQMSVPPSLGGGPAGAPPGQFGGQFSHPVVGQTQYPQYHPMSGFPGGVHTQMNKTSELSPQTSVDLGQQPAPSAGPIGSGVVHHAHQVKDQGSMLDLIGGGSQQNSSRSGTPGLGGHRKSPTADQGTQVGSGAGGQQRESRRGSNAAPKQQQHQQHQQPYQQQNQQRNNRTNSRNRQRYPSGGGGVGGQGGGVGGQGGVVGGQSGGSAAGTSGSAQHQQNLHQQSVIQQSMHQHPQPHHQQHQGNYNRGGWRGRARGRGRGFVPRTNNKLKFDNDYDFEQANTEFEELRSQLAKTKISEGEVKPEAPPAEGDKKDDSGNETGAGEPEVEDDNAYTYDKNKSFFDNISCEAVERSKGRSQRTDWRTERKLNSETFGVASARRGAWRGRGNWRHNPHQQPWRPMRGGGGNMNMSNMNMSNMNNRGRNNQNNNAPLQQPHRARPAAPPMPV